MRSHLFGNAKEYSYKNTASRMVSYTGSDTGRTVNKGEPILPPKATGPLDRYIGSDCVQGDKSWVPVSVWGFRGRSI